MGIVAFSSADRLRGAGAIRPASVVTKVPNVPAAMPYTS